MKKLIKTILLKTPILNAFVLDKMMEIPHGEKGIEQVGHRVYVGGLWDEMGSLQFEMLKHYGLKPNHVFIDVACGSLRLGKHLIEYLDEGNYQGIDKESTLVEMGSREEVDETTLEEKKPKFVISSEFEFHKFPKKADFAIAQSLFTHLPEEIIDSCFSKLAKHVNPGAAFFATFFETESEYENYEIPHDHARFYFSRQQILDFGKDDGWNAEYIGDWSHPREQKLCKYVFGKAGKHGVEEQQN